MSRLDLQHSTRRDARIIYDYVISRDAAEERVTGLRKRRSKQGRPCECGYVSSGTYLQCKACRAEGFSLQPNYDPRVNVRCDHVHIIEAPRPLSEWQGYQCELVANHHEGGITTLEKPSPHRWGGVLSWTYAVAMWQRCAHCKNEQRVEVHLPPGYSMLTVVKCPICQHDAIRSPLTNVTMKKLGQ